MTSQILMTDEEVADMMHIAKRTLVRRLKHPITGEVDMNAAEPGVFGGKRFWLRKKVEQTLGIGSKNG